MIGLLQRASEARVDVDGMTVGAIERGLLVFIGVQKGDDEARARRLVERLLGYRVFADSQGRMNLCLKDTGDGLLLVPQFTLAADTGKGTRPGFSAAAPPQEGQRLFTYLCDRARALHQPVACGVFGANMQVELVNDGPVTFWLRT